MLISLNHQKENNKERKQILTIALSFSSFARFSIISRISFEMF